MNSILFTNHIFYYSRKLTPRPSVYFRVCLGELGGRSVVFVEQDVRVLARTETNPTSKNADVRECIVRLYSNHFLPAPVVTVHHVLNVPADEPVFPTQTNIFRHFDFPAVAVGLGTYTSRRRGGGHYYLRFAICDCLCIIECSAFVTITLVFHWYQHIDITACMYNGLPM